MFYIGLAFLVTALVRLLKITKRRGPAMKIYLILIGLAINQTTYATQLHHAVLKDDVKAAQQFLDEYPYLINAPDVAYGGWPALHYAAYFGKEKMVQLLVARGANVTLTDIFGKMAIDYARLQNRHWVIWYLTTRDLQNQIKK